MPHLFRENLCKKQYCNVTKTNRFVLKILEKLNHFVLKVRTGGFADSTRTIRSIRNGMKERWRQVVRLPGC